MTPTKNPMTRKTICIVSDDAIQRASIAAILESEAYDILLFDGADTALDAFDHIPAPAIIITDLHMPVIDGWRFCRLLRSQEYPAYNRVPILIVSATYSSADAREVSLELGANAFLSYPVDSKTLTTHVKNLIAGRHAQAKPKALVVEDSRTAAHMIRDALNQHGFDAHIALNADEGRTAFSSINPELVVLDYHLPRESGGVLLKEWRKARPATAIIMITTDPDPKLAREFMCDGAAAYIRKPFDLEYLADLASKALRERAMFQIEELLDSRTRELQDKEARLQSALAELHALFNAIPAYFHVVDTSFRVVDVSEAYLRFRGHENKSAVVGRKCHVVWRNRDFVCPDCAVAAVLDSGAPITRINGTDPDDATGPWFRTHAAPIMDASGHIRGVIECLFDITEIQLAQKQRIEALRFLDAILANSHDVIVIYDLDGRYVRVSHNMAEASGVPVSMIEGRTFEEVLPPDVASVAREYLRQVIENGEAIQEDHAISVNNIPYSLKSTISPIFDENARLCACASITTDITDKIRAETGLRDAASHLQIIFNEAPIAIFSMDENGVVLSWNPEAERMYGWTAQEVIGIRVPTFPHDSEAEFERLRQFLLDGNTIRNYETIRMRKDGSRINVSVSTAPIFSERVVVAFTTDITEHKKAEEDLNRTHELQKFTREALASYISSGDPMPVFHSMLETMVSFTASQFGFLEEVSKDGGRHLRRNLAISGSPWSENSKALFMNQITGHMEFQPLNEANDNAAFLSDLLICNDPASLPCSALLPVAIPELCNLMIIPLRYGGDFVGYIGLANRPDGFNTKIASFLEPLSSACSGIMYAVKNKQRENELARKVHKSERRLRQLLESVSWLAVTVQAHGAVSYCNERLASMAGLPSAEIVGKNWFDMFIPPDKRDALRTICDAVVDSGIPASSVEAPLITADGSTHIIAWDITPMRGPAGLPTGFSKLGRDITEQRDLEKQLRQAQKLEAIGLLAGGIAHDFNNILQVIQGYGDMISASLPPEDPLSNDLAEMMKAANRATSLVRQLLSFSRRQSLERQLVNLNNVIHDLMKILRRNAGERISILFQPHPTPLYVMAGPGQIEQVIMNLCANARDAMPQGGSIRISINDIMLRQDDLLVSLPGGRYAELTISDTGPGIPLELRDRLFEPFLTTKDIGKGSGLGLATAYGIVQQHDGAMLLNDTERGASFRILLPVSSSDGIIDDEKKALP